MLFDHFVFNGVSPFPEYRYTDNDPRDNLYFSSCPMTAHGIQVQRQTKESSISSRIVYDNEEYPIYSTPVDQLIFILSITTGVAINQEGIKKAITNLNSKDIGIIDIKSKLTLRNCTIEPISNGDLYGDRINEVIEKGLFLISDGDLLSIGLLTAGESSTIETSDLKNTAYCGYFPHLFNKIWGIPKGCPEFTSKHIDASRSTTSK